MLTQFLLLCLPLTILASQCDKLRTHLECRDLSLEQLLIHYEDEEILKLDNFTTDASAVSWNSSRLSAVNTFQAAHAEVDSENFAKLVSLPHLSTLQFESSKIDFGSKHSSIFLNPSLRNMRLANSFPPTEQILNFTFLSELDLSNNNLTEVPKICGEQIIYLNLSKTSLRKVANLKKLPSLEELDLSHNGLRMIFMDAFINNEDLERLNLQHNDLKSIHFNASNLLNLYLDFNDMEIIQGEYFSGMKSLSYLSLTNNNISILDDPFKYLKDLKNIDLSYNQLEVLNGEWFQNNLELESIKISNNEISNLVDLKEKLPRLHYLDISTNAIKVLDEKFFSKTPALAVLDASHNQIKMIDDALPYMISLNKLYIAFNVLEVQEGTFVNAFQLNTLNASHNDLYMTLDVFKYNKMLRDVDLSYNAITQLCQGTKAPPQILNLNIRKNKVRNLNCLSQLTSFDVEENPLTCNKQLGLKLKQLLEEEIPTLKSVTTPSQRTEVEVFGESENVESVLEKLCPNGLTEEDDDDDEIIDTLDEVIIQNNMDPLDNSEVTKASAVASTVSTLKNIEHDDTATDTYDESYTADESEESEEDSDEEDTQSQRDSVFKLDAMLHRLAHHPSKSWAHWAFILLGVCLVLLVLNVMMFVWFRRRARADARLGSDRPYEQLNNEVYKDTTSRVEGNQRSVNFGQAISTFKNEKLEEILAKFGFRTLQTDCESQARMIPVNPTV